MADAKCNSCGAPIRWAISESSGKAIPLDIETVADGNIIETGMIDPSSKSPVIRYLKKSESITFPKMGDLFGSSARDDVHRYVSHFATCPNADQHRKKR